MKSTILATVFTLAAAVAPLMADNPHTVGGSFVVPIAGTVNGQAAMPGAFAGVHHHLLPERPSLVVGCRQPVRPRERMAVPFAQPYPLRGQQRRGKIAADFGDRGKDLRRTAD